MDVTILTRIDFSDFAFSPQFLCSPAFRLDQADAGCLLLTFVQSAMSLRDTIATEMANFRESQVQGEGK